jgi:hypothetical protein
MEMEVYTGSSFARSHPILHPLARPQYL